MERPETPERYLTWVEIDAATLADGPAVKRVLDDLRERFDLGLAEHHRITVSEVSIDRDHDPTRDVTMIICSARTIRDPAWVAAVRAEAEAAAVEDMRWFAALRVLGDVGSVV